MFAVKSILEQLHNVVANSVLRSKALRPSQDLPLIERRLFDREAECETERDSRLLRK